MLFFFFFAWVAGWWVRMLDYLFFFTEVSSSSSSFFYILSFISFSLNLMPFDYFLCSRYIPRSRHHHHGCHFVTGVCSKIHYSIHVLGANTSAGSGPEHLRALDTCPGFSHPTPSLISALALALHTGWLFFFIYISVDSWHFSCSLSFNT